MEEGESQGFGGKDSGLNRDVKRARHELDERRSQAQALKTALDGSGSLVHALQAQERCASMTVFPPNHSHLFFRALTAQLNSQQEKIRSLTDTESYGSPVRLFL